MTVSTPKEPRSTKSPLKRYGRSRDGRPAQGSGVRPKLSPCPPGSTAPLLPRARASRIARVDWQGHVTRGPLPSSRSGGRSPLRSAVRGPLKRV